MSKPFENIAVSLSGGGYRAAAFHLGALSYLDQLQYEGSPLLQKVTLISTISGGTFTGVGYVLALAEGNNFKYCYHKLYRLLTADKLVLEAMQMINQTKDWKAQAKNKNLINAFSEIYQAEFCNNHHLSDLFHASEMGHLEEFCFNATDLHDSIPFRFQKTGKFGNGKMYISHDAANEIRLGDVMAASSCFPGGFEPMAFPMDFIKEKGSVLDREWQDKGYPTNIALMDGGILDNQGIESVELANNRRPEDKKIDTFIISDVSTRNPIPFKFPASGKPGLFGNLTYRSIITLLMVNAALALFGMWWFWFGSRLVLVLASLLATFSVLFLFTLYSIQKALDNAITSTVDQASETPAILQHLEILEKTPVHVLLNLVKARFSSLSDITENTFMARIRSLQLKYVYDNTYWEHKVISNNIYSLFTDYQSVPEIPTPSPAMLKTTEQAALMPTSLWFTAKEKEAGMLDLLIISGQINLCFQLLRYLIEEQDSFTEDMRPPLQTLKDSLLADYQKFIANEKWLLEELNVMA